MVSATSKIYIEYLDISKIESMASNPKDHAIDQLYASFERFGFITPMIVNEATNKLVAGKGRLDGLRQQKAMGNKPPLRIVVDEQGKWLAPVIRGISFENESEALAYVIADNRLTELGGWHTDLLTDQLGELSAQSTDDNNMLAGLGYDFDDVDKMLANMGEHNKQNNSKQTDSNTSNTDADSNYMIMIECDSYEQQMLLLSTLSTQGLKCRPLTS